MPKQQQAKIGGNKAKSRQHHHKKDKYAAKFARTEENRKRKLAKHLKRHPNDAQAAQT